MFGLAKYTKATFTQVHPGGCTDPGDLIGNDGEAILDAEYASAAAPDAAIVLASCADTETTFGGLIALQTLIKERPPSIISISYGECEAEHRRSRQRGLQRGLRRQRRRAFRVRLRGR